MYNLTSTQQIILSWLVQQIRDGKLAEDFYILWESGGRARLASVEGSVHPSAKFTKPVVKILTDEAFLATSDEHQYTVTNKSYQAVDANFDAPDTSFLRYLTPFADTTNLDDELKVRCLPLLGIDGAAPLLWDSVVRTAVVILEERLRDVGQIADRNITGGELVNKVFGQNGTLASKFQIASERNGYRDIYAGVVGAFRNRYAHRLMDPKPEDGGEFIIFVNLLLRMLEELRK